MPSLRKMSDIESITVNKRLREGGPCFFSLFCYLQKKSRTVPGAEWAEAYNQSRGGTHSCFCYAPSVNMYFSQDGTVRVCCHNMEYSIGKYPEQSIREIWNSAKAHELRRHMRNYDLSHGCRVCEADVRMGSFHEVPARHFDHIPRNPDYPGMMEFLISNTCNLECIMCKGEYSSLIRKNREHRPPLITPYDKKFLEQLEEFIPYLHETRFSGSGEAFSIDMNYEIWEMLIRKNPRCVIMVQTNGTILTARVKDVLSRGNFHIGVSVDGMKKETYESIRLHANFDKVMDNIRYFSRYCTEKNSRFSLAMCVMRSNWREVPEFISFCNAMNAAATLHKVWTPLEHALYKLPQQELEDIYKFLSAFDFPADTPLQQGNRNHYRYFAAVVNQWAAQEAEIARVKSLRSEELLPYLRKKMQRSFSAGNEDAQHQRELFDSLIKKLQVIIQAFEGEQGDKLLRWACAEKADVVIQSLRNHSVESLVEQAKAVAGMELEELH